MLVESWQSRACLLLWACYFHIFFISHNTPNQVWSKKNLEWSNQLWESFHLCLLRQRAPWGVNQRSHKYRGLPPHQPGRRRQAEGSNIESFHQNQPAQLQPQGAEGFSQTGVNHWLSRGLKAEQTPWKTGLVKLSSSKVDWVHWTCCQQVLMSTRHNFSQMCWVCICTSANGSLMLVQNEAFHVNSPTHQSHGCQLSNCSSSFEHSTQLFPFKHYHSNFDIVLHGISTTVSSAVLALHVASGASRRNRVLGLFNSKVAKVRSE